MEKFPALGDRVNAMISMAPRLRYTAIAFLAATLALLSFARATQPPIGWAKTGENIGQYEVTSAKGVKTPIDSIKGKYKIVFYFASVDKETQGKLMAIETILELFDSPDITYLLVWEGEIPNQQLENGKIPIQNNYAIKSDDIPLTPQPSWGYFVDEKNQIIINGFYSYGDLVEKLDTLFDLKEIRNKVVKSLDARLADKHKSKRDLSKDDLFYFYIPGCSRCEAELKTVGDNLKILQGKYNIWVVPPEMNGDGVEAKDFLKDSTIVDYSGVLFTALHEPRDPFFILAARQNPIPKEMESVDEVIQYAHSPRAP